MEAGFQLEGSSVTLEEQDDPVTCSPSISASETGLVVVLVQCTSPLKPLAIFKE